jgi:hypothetical protein
MPGFDALGLKEIVAVTAWYIWWVRRRQTHNEEVPPLFRRKMSILAIVANSAKGAKTTNHTTEATWVRPNPRQVKVNVDATFFEDSRSSAVGAVLRDFQGQFIAASCKYIPSIPSVEIAEALAMKEGLYFSRC